LIDRIHFLPHPADGLAGRTAVFFPPHLETKRPHPDQALILRTPLARVTEGAVVVLDFLQALEREISFFSKPACEAALRACTCQPRMDVSPGRLLVLL
jgi:hypothetical protein